MPTSAPIQRGTVVYDVADPRHHGIVRSLNLSEDRRFVANVQWLDGPPSRVPVANLRRVTSETPSQPDRAKPRCVAFASDPRRAPRIGFGVYDGFPTRFSSDTGEIWVCFTHVPSRGRKGTWSEPTRPMQVYCYETRVLTEAEYCRSFPDVPPLPDAAFRSGWRSPLV